MHFILCDEIDSGKSRLILKLARELIASGTPVSGWITPAHMEKGRKVGHDFIAIDCGKLRAPVPFTRLHAFEGSVDAYHLSGLGTRLPAGQAGDSALGKSCPYHFNQWAFERAEALTHRLFRITNHESRVTDIFIMDEIGPLELEEKSGFWVSFERAMARKQTTLIAMRTQLKKKIVEYVHTSRWQTFSRAQIASLKAQIKDISSQNV